MQSHRIGRKGLNVKCHGCALSSIRSENAAALRTMSANTKDSPQPNILHMVKWNTQWLNNVRKYAEYNFELCGGYVTMTSSSWNWNGRFYCFFFSHLIIRFFFTAEHFIQLMLHILLLPVHFGHHVIYAFKKLTTVFMFSWLYHRQHIHCWTQHRGCGPRWRFNNSFRKICTVSRFTWNEMICCNSSFSFDALSYLHRK